MIEKRRCGNNPLIENQIESVGMVDKETMYKHIKEILIESTEAMSSKEIAIEMKKRGYTITAERQNVAPRITELLQNGELECVGKKKCKYSRKKVGVFVLRRGDYERR